MQNSHLHRIQCLSSARLSVQLWHIPAVKHQARSWSTSLDLFAIGSANSLSFVSYLPSFAHRQVWQSLSANIFECLSIVLWQRLQRCLVKPWASGPLSSRTWPPHATAWSRPQVGWSPHWNWMVATSAFKLIGSMHHRRSMRQRPPGPICSIKYRCQRLLRAKTSPSCSWHCYSLLP